MDAFNKNIKCGASFSMLLKNQWASRPCKSHYTAHITAGDSLALPVSDNTGKLIYYNGISETVLHSTALHLRLICNKKIVTLLSCDSVAWKCVIDTFTSRCSKLKCMWKLNVGDCILEKAREFVKLLSCYSYSLISNSKRTQLQSQSIHLAYAFH